MGVQLPHGNRNFSDGSGFPRLLSTNVPIGRLQKQSSVILNFPNEKSPARCGLSSKVFDRFLLLLKNSGRPNKYTPIAGYCSNYDSMVIC